MSRYAGHVTSGGASDVRELRELIIRKCSVGEYDNNAYLLTCRTTGEQLLVDAAADAPRAQAGATYCMSTQCCWPSGKTTRHWFAVTCCTVAGKR